MPPPLPSPSRGCIWQMCYQDLTCAIKSFGEGANGTQNCPFISFDRKGDNAENTMFTKRRNLSLTRILCCRSNIDISSFIVPHFSHRADYVCVCVNRVWKWKRVGDIRRDRREDELPREKKGNVQQFGARFSPLSPGNSGFAKNTSTSVCIKRVLRERSLRRAQCVMYDCFAFIRESIKCVLRFPLAVSSQGDEVRLSLDPSSLSENANDTTKERDTHPGREGEFREGEPLYSPSVGDDCAEDRLFAAD